MKKYSYHVSGTHCNSCKILIEDILSENKNLKNVSVDVKKKTVEIEGEFGETNVELMNELNKSLAEHKYVLSEEKRAENRDHTSILIALPIGLTVLFLFFLLQKSGIINFGISNGLNLWTAFLIGIIASLSSCLAVVGGLILSLSAEVAKTAKTFKPFLFFHSGRIFGFIVLGAGLGILGNAISINYFIANLLGIFAAIIMILLGLNLIDVLRFNLGLKPSISKKIFSKIQKIENGNIVPLLFGVATFFLPCGFTQSMQIAAISSGSWIEGAKIMGMFSLGTLPMLILLSFSSYKFAHTKYAKIFFKTAGIVVIGLGIFAVLGGLAGLGIIRPIFNF